MLGISNDEKLIAETIIGNLDEAGYLSRSVDAIVDDLAFSQGIQVSEELIEHVLKKFKH